MSNEINALALPDPESFKQQIEAINKFQNVVHATLIPDLDFGIVPGTTKPTLLKPGAEKIAKLLGLSDQYEIVDRQEDWTKPFFRYLIRCKLIHVVSQSLITEGLGECNSMESKYRWRWLSERDLPVGIDKTKLITQERTAKTGGHWIVFRFENDDIYSQVNTILKMAKKRALVDAALSAGRLSNVFTQDIEDMGVIEAEVVESKIDTTQHYCSVHKTAFFKRGKMKSYAHPIGDTGEWCHEHTEDKAKVDVVEGEAHEIKEEITSTEEVPGEAPSEIKPDGIDMDWVRESIKQLHWTDQDVKQWIAKTFQVSVSVKDSLAITVGKLNPEQQQLFCQEIQGRLGLL